MDARGIRELVSKMSVEEKCSLCSGKDMWNTKAVERLGIPSIMMTDGPHGLRKQASPEGGFTKSVPSTCFPSGASLASSWDRALVEEVGKAIGLEARSEKVGVLLGPAVNIKRSPLCGRNFEYLSEDPYLAGELAAAHVAGVQSNRVGASVKHFAANNQEKGRMIVDAAVGERALREIYLPAFEAAVKKSQPWTVMCAYNKINGEYCSQNRWLLTGVLKEEWGHEGIVVTDWGACDDRVLGLKAGQELEMPGNGGINDKHLVQAVKDGSLPIAALDAVVERLLSVTFKAAEGSAEVSYDRAAHHAKARKAASECMVLLKNDGILPLPKQGRLAVIGAFAKKPRYQGGGSSHIEPTQMDDAVEELSKALPGMAISYAPGYDPASDAVDEALIAEARAAAKAADLALVFVGLTDLIESEGYDRAGLSMPAAHDRLVAAVAEVQPNLVVCLSNGSPVLMPWLGSARAVLETYLGGQAWGGAVADALSGAANPSGKLAETFPARLEDTPAFLDFPGEPRRVEYNEGVFIGYRHYDARALPTLFPFGHGLSYTSFSYSDLRLDRQAVGEDGRLTVTCRVANSGKVAGAEVAQLYVGRARTGLVRPRRELKGFAKVRLEPGEAATVSFELDRRSFAHWDAEAGAWAVEPGEAEISVGSSSRDLRLTASVALRVKARGPKLDRNLTVGEVAAMPGGAAMADRFRKAFLGGFGINDSGSVQAEMMRRMVDELPLRNVVRMARGGLKEEELQGVLEELGRAQS